MLRRLAKPEYAFRPKQLLLRLARGRGRIPPLATVELPWGLPLEVAPAETVGRGIWRLGVHELVVSEVLWRLIDPGEMVADVGANYGYFTSLMAVRSGTAGSVMAFEPHPAMLDRVTTSAQLWRGLPGVSSIEVFPFALSDRNGSADLRLPAGFEANTGTAFLAGNAAPDTERTVRVERRRLDSVLAPSRCPSVIKIDVEGHEIHVLAGAGDLVERRLVRDIVFEEHAPYPSPSSIYLERHGYSIYRLRRTFLRPVLDAPGLTNHATGWEAANYLATVDPDRASFRLRAVGWKCLSRARDRRP